MKNNQSFNLEHMEGRNFIIGREGHIYIDSPTASKHHAEIRIRGGKIYLRDLKSTNGTFIVKNKALVPFDEGYVNPQQPIFIGGQPYVIWELLMIAGDFAAIDGAKTQFDISRNNSVRRSSA